MEIRKCNICKQIKPLSEFYKDSSCAGGHAYRCKICDKKKGTRWARESGYDRKEARRNRDNPQRQAKSEVKSQIERGKMPRASECQCADCGQQAAHYHHESYAKDKWLDVIPLCVSCHRKRHAKKDYGYEGAHA